MKQSKSGMFFMVTVFLCGCIFLNSCVRIDPEENEIFEERKESFELVNSYVLENFGHFDEREFVLVCRDDEKEIDYIYNDGNIEISDEIKDALTVIGEAIRYNFNSICVENHRITYGGDSYRQYVYSRDGKVPKYFYHEGDGMHPDIYYLGDDWYLLVVNFI